MTATQTWEQWQAAFDRDSRRFANNRDRCQDCRLIEACRCGNRWLHLPKRRREGGKR